MIFLVKVEGGGRSRSSSEPTRYKGRDLRYEVVLDFNEAVIGTKEMLLSEEQTYKTCNACNGAGEVNYSQGFFSVSRSRGSCGELVLFLNQPKIKMLKLKFRLELIMVQDLESDLKVMLEQMVVQWRLIC